MSDTAPHSKTIVVGVRHEYAPQFQINYKNKDDLYQYFLNEVNKRNARHTEICWTDCHSDRIEITDADRLFDIVNMNPTVELTVRCVDDCLKSTPNGSAHIMHDKMKNKSPGCTSPLCHLRSQASCPRIAKAECKCMPSHHCNRDSPGVLDCHNPKNYHAHQLFHDPHYLLHCRQFYHPWNLHSGHHNPPLVGGSGNECRHCGF